VNEGVKPELADDFLGFGRNLLAANEAFQVWSAVFLAEVLLHRAKRRIAEMSGGGEGLKQIGEKVGIDHRGRMLPGKLAAGKGEVREMREKLPAQALRPAEIDGHAVTPWRRS
jgi:hypothetical protein